MANGFGFMPMETPTYGGGLLQPPTPPQPQGLGLLPLIVGALGSAADPSFGQNFLYGLGMRQQQAQNNYRNQMQNYRLQRQDQAQQMKLEQMRSAAEAEAQQRAGVVQALRDRGIPENQIPLYLANDDAMKSLFREEPEQWSQPFTIDIGGRPQLVQTNEATGQFRTIGQGPMVQVNTGAQGGAITDRAPSPEEEARAGVEPGTTLIREGRFVPKPVSDLKKQEDRLNLTKKELPGLAAEYRKRFAEYQALNPLTSPFETQKARDLAEAAKEQLVTSIAIIESRGAEPNPAKFENVRERVPDFAGVYDRAVFADRMNQLEQLQMGDQAPAAAQPAQPEQPGQVLTYNPATGQLE